MKVVVGTAPEVYNEFMAGKFVVQRTKRPFSIVSTGMPLEQTQNRDVMNTGGLIGKSNCGYARSRRYLTAQMKAQVSSEMSIVSGQAQHTEHVVITLVITKPIVKDQSHGHLQLLKSFKS